MRELLRTTFPVALLLLLASACGRSSGNVPRRGPCVFDSDCPAGLRCVNAQCVEWQEPDAGRGVSKLFGEPCETGDECLSGRCLGGPRGQFCTNPCGEEQQCPSGFACKVVPAPGVDGKTESLCALPQPLLCQPCRSDLECGGSGGDHCIASGLYGFCGQDCTYDACPEGYACEETSRGRQCQPIGKTCDCDPGQVGRFRGCGLENEHGECYGRQECRLEGWSECSARAAQVETCNGVDDDCNGRVDDALPETTCKRQNAFGTCLGLNACMGASGDRCDAPTPAAESCNYVDDDCDGTVDDGFVDARGRYVGAEYCGGCGNRCASLIKSSLVTECVVEDSGAPACRVKTCQPGFYPSADRKQCLKLADSLCRSCVEDSDCAGPGSRCVELNGEKICGRDCGPDSQFPACPGGYKCQTTAAGAQCVPTSGLCECNATQLGITRSCTVQTCTGFQACAQSSTGPQWSACDVESFNPEICDGADNNCDGRIDEAFKNAATGRYDKTAHCGFCNNDCSKYWSPTLDHTTGVCDASAATPTCKMGPCTSETAGGITYDWVNVNGDTQDGCECRRVKGNLTQDEPDEQAPFTDENCDGIDGVATDALFVWGGAAAGGNGTITAPYRTVTQGVAALGAYPAKRYVLVAEGAYAENVVFGPGVRLYGGYARDFKRRDPLLYATVIRGQAPGASGGASAAIYARQIPATASQAVVNGFSIRGFDQPAAADNKDGYASYAILVEDCSNRLRITGNDILAGRGGKGGRGSTGTQGFGRQQDAALDGKGGYAQTREYGSCPASTARAGGAAGANATCATSNGAPGGGVVCPVYDWSVMPRQGNQAAYAPNSNRNGEGGFDRSFDSSSEFDCHHATESGFPSNIQTNDGRIGLAGADGTSGSGGAGAAPLARLGSIQSNRWSASSFRASAGGVGANAEGGGGGGAGGGTAYYPSGGCMSHEVGATGGGGGAGGCGGGGGGPGGSGGASIAVFVTFSSTPPATQLPVITGNRIARNLGGDGGNGGYGGVGGRGGAGGLGGSSTTWSGSSGGKGGDGGNGGVGGGGGGGAGGPSFGILAFRSSSADWSAQNTFLTQASAASGGKGGAGGSSSGAGATGAPGVDGASANLHVLLPCAAGCPAPGQCDANGVCATP